MAVNTQPTELGKTGSAVRMAVLGFLSIRPEGVAFSVLSDVMAQIHGRPLTEAQARNVARHLQAAGLLAFERNPNGVPGGNWFSPAARQAATVRGNWRPKKEVEAIERANAQTAAALARALEAP